MVVASGTKLPSRSEIPIEFTWDLTILFADDNAWEHEFEAVTEALKGLTQFQGKLAESSATLLKALQMRDALGVRVGSLFTYARQGRDGDGSDPRFQALAERVTSLGAKAQTAASFIEPEILAIDQAVIEAWLQNEPELQVYTQYFRELSLKRAHIRSIEVEGVLAQYAEIDFASLNTFDVLTNTDMVFPEFEDENGQRLQVSHGRFDRYRRSQDARVRRDVYKGYYSGYRTLKNTLAATLSTMVRSHNISARIRNYGSALEAALEPSQIPTAVYHNLIETVDRNLPRLHRYVALRKKLLGLDELYMYDMYVPLVKDVNLEFSYDAAKSIILEALAPLGGDYAYVLRRAFNERWIDVYENQGKSSGAYSGGDYQSPPYILMNYQSELNSMYTLAHELGHSVHSYFTRRAQPPIYADYKTFVAEVASTLDEALLTDYLLKHRADPLLRKHLIVEQLDGIRGTILRQTQFATFELEIHERSARGEALTADALSATYFDLNKRYYGPDVTYDDDIALEWARIPHFYLNFYVFQYATGLSAALALSQQIINEGAPAVERYLKFLSGGSSKSPIDLLKDAGVDMTSPAPVQAALDKFDTLLDELEALS